MDNNLKELKEKINNGVFNNPMTVEYYEIFEHLFEHLGLKKYLLETVKFMYILI